jgi:hypothetical protein
MLNQWIHVLRSFLFPSVLIDLVAGPEEAKNLAAKKDLCPIQIRFTDGRAVKKSRLRVKHNRRMHGPPIRVSRNAVSFSSARTTKR